MYHGKDIREAEYRDQRALKESFEEFKNYNPTNAKYKKEKKDLLDNAEKLYKGREMIINAFKKDMLKVADNVYDEDEDHYDENIDINTADLIGLADLDRIINENNNNITKKVFSNYFISFDLKSLKKYLIYYQKNEEDTYKKYKDRVKDGIEKLEIDKRKIDGKKIIEKTNNTIKAIEMILNYVDQEKKEKLKNMPDLESEEDAVKSREKSGKGLKY